MFVTHPKLRTLVPDWAPFSGYSAILHTRGASADRFLTTPEATPVLQTVAEALQKADPVRLMRAGLLCLLPPESYHVTVADLLHQGNIAHLPADLRREIETALAPSQAGDCTVPELLTALGLATCTPLSRPLTLRVAALEILSGRVLVLRLQPAQAQDALILNEISTWRSDVTERLAIATGLPATQWYPHLSLGYFAAPDLLADHMADLTPLLETIESRVLEQVISFDAISLYKFSSMVEYQRLS